MSEWVCRCPFCTQIIRGLNHNDTLTIEGVIVAPPLPALITHIHVHVAQW